MAGSECEERIRSVVVDSLRRTMPTARIIHELMLRQGVGPRLDVAAVTPDRIVLVEIKSERDVLKRLQAQVEASLLVTNDVRVVVAEKHRKAVVAMERPYLLDPVTERTVMTPPDAKGHQRSVPNPAYIEGLTRCTVQVETPQGLERAGPYTGLLHGPRDPVAMVSSGDLWELLWHGEAATVLNAYGLQAGARTNRHAMKMAAMENLTGGQVRRGVCAMLRSRNFARADERVDHGLQPVCTPRMDLFRDAQPAPEPQVDPAWSK